MAKFCGKCGSKLDEATGICPNCDAEKIKKQTERATESVEAVGKKAEPTQHQEEQSNKSEAKEKRKADKKAAKKDRKAQKKAEKKAKKKEKWAKLPLGQKVQKLILKMVFWVALLIIISLGILGSLDYFNLIKLPVISNAMDYFEIESEDDSNAAQFNHLDAGFTDILVVDETSAISAAQEAAKILGLVNAADELTVSSINVVDDMTYYRLQQNHNGIPIVGKSMVVIADNLGNAVGFTTNAVSIEAVSFDTPPDTETILTNLTIYLNEHKYDLSEHEVTVDSCTEDKRAYYESDFEVFPVYVLQVFFNKLPISFATVTVNARTGEIIEFNNSIYEDVVTVYNADQTIPVNGYYDQSSNEYQLYDSNRGILIYSYENTDSTTGNATQTFITSQNEFFGDTQEEIALEQEKGIKLLSYVAKINDYYIDVMRWDGYGKTYCYYNDGYYSGKNALGGNASLASGEVIGYLSMGSITGIDALDTMAHEYTHIVSRKIVSWQSVEAWSEHPDEPGAINEGYSDIFGEILESYLSKTEPDWVHGSRIISNPMSRNYPAAGSVK